MAGEIFPISSVQIIEKCILESFPPPLHDLIISSHVKQPHYKLAQKSMFPHAKLFHEKKMSQYFQGEETLCFIIISFPISKSFIYNFCGTNYGLSSKTT